MVSTYREAPVGELTRKQIGQMVERADAGKLSEDDVETVRLIHATAQRFSGAQPVFMVTVESEGFSADWLDDVIVIAKDEQDAILGAETTVREYRPNVTIKGGDGSSEVYRLAVEHPRVVGILVPRDER